MVLRGQRQERQKAARAGSQHLFCALAPLGVELVADGRGASGAGAGCDDVEETLYGAVYQCRLSRLCHPGGLEGGGRGGGGLGGAALGRAAPPPCGGWT